GSRLRPRGKDGACEESPLLPTLARRIAALSGQGPATQDQPTPRRRALVCRVAAQPQAAGAWRPVESPRSTSEREPEQFEAQTRVRSFFDVFSCAVGGVGVGELEVSRATFLWRRSFLGTCHLESSEIKRPRSRASTPQLQW